MPFVCQRCKQPLRIHDSLSDLSPAAFDLLAGAHRTQPAQLDTPATRSAPPSARASAHIPADRRSVYDKALKGQDPQQQTPLVKRVIPSVKNGSPPAGTRVPSGPRSNESFVVLTQSQIQRSPPKQDGVPNGTTTGSAENGAERRRISAKLFDAISGRSDIDYPMCTECADILLENMSAKHTEVKKERDGYLDYIKGLQSEGQVTPEEVTTAEKELEDVTPPPPFS